MMIYAVKVMKMLKRSNCECYLVYIVGVIKEEPTIEIIPIVREYQDVFLESLYG